MIRRHRLFVSTLASCATLLFGLAACAPRLEPLRGITPVNGVLPTLQLPAGSRQIVFTWELQQSSIVARGDCAVRLISPDSARIDIFLAGGFGRGAAILIGDSLHLPPGGGLGEDMIPPTTLIWAALGRLALPAIADTVIRISGDTTRADIGHPVKWRLTIVGERLARLEHVSGGHIVESIARSPDGLVRYESSSHRSLVLHLQHDQPVAALDASIWHF
jgi:hypothetical protein